MGGANTRHNHLGEFRDSGLRRNQQHGNQSNQNISSGRIRRPDSLAVSGPCHRQQSSVGWELAECDCAHADAHRGLGGVRHDVAAIDDDSRGVSMALLECPTD